MARRKAGPTYKYLDPEETKDDWLQWVPSIKEAIEVGYLDGYLKDLAVAARTRWNTVKASEEAMRENPMLDPAVDGIYQDPETKDLYRVAPTRKDATKKYASLLTEVEPALYDVDGSVRQARKMKWEYEKSKVFDLMRRPEWKLDVDGIRACSEVAGVCLRCLKALGPTSPYLKDMVGSVCHGKILKGEW